MNYNVLYNHVKYDRATGLFFRKKREGLVVLPLKVGNAGYGYITVEGKRYMAHRLAYLYVFRKLPLKPLQIDHINRNKLDNRIENLRVVTPSQNMCNIGLISSNTSGHRGISLRGSKFEVNIQYQGVPKYLGVFDSLEEASNVYKSARKELHGEFTDD